MILQVRQLQNSLLRLCLRFAVHVKAMSGFILAQPGQLRWISKLEKIPVIKLAQVTSGN
ncbi:MAG: hypothetical protein FWG02_00060 [Holophagaceae bacterium]|nr:hypothetical protein [Holophagaceae bacterium]